MTYLSPYNGTQWPFYISYQSHLPDIDHATFNIYIQVLTASTRHICFVAVSAGSSLMSHKSFQFKLIFIRSTTLAGSLTVSLKYIAD